MLGEENKMYTLNRFFLAKSIVCVSIILMAAGGAWSGIGDDDPPDIATVDTLLFEDFSGPEGPFENNPLPEWTVIDSGVPEWDETSWSRYYNSPYPDYWNGDLARVMFSGTGAIGDWLITPVFSCVSDNLIMFSFKQRHSNRSQSDNDTIFVYGSTDGGANWDHTVYMETESRGGLNQPDTVQFDLSSWAVGYDNVRLAFYFKGDDVLTWYIDEPHVWGDFSDTLLYEDFNGDWGEFGNNPPGGWSIINEIVPDPPNENDWGRWYYETWPDMVALAYDNRNNQTANEWLITPTFSFGENSICSLSYYLSYWDDSWDDTDSAFVRGSIDGGQTWDYIVVAYGDVDDRDMNKEDSWRGFDLSSWAQGQDNVKIAFHYVKDDPSYIGWWFFDDLTITEIAVYNDNVAVLSIDYPSEFVVVNREYNPMVTVQNLSLEQQTIDLMLVVLDTDEIVVYFQREEDIALEPGEISQLTFSLPFIPETEGDHYFIAEVNNPGDQDPADDTVAETIPSYVHVGSDGPDAFGYHFIDNTEPDGPEYNWIEISETGTQVEPGMHYFMSGEISMGLDMEFYGETYSSIWINSHGELHLGSRDTWLSTNDCPLPDQSTPHAPLLAVFWDLLYIHYEQGLGVYYQQFSEPENQFVVQWEAKPEGQNSDPVKFQAILYESGEIVYQYAVVNDGISGRGQTATVGMEYDAIPSGLSYLCDDNNPANRLEEGLAIKWYIPQTSVDDSEDFLPGSFTLGQNYPNPFNAKTSIAYDLPQQSRVKIEIFDMLGRLVETLEDIEKPAGRYRVSWDAGDMSSGMYFYKITASGFIDIKKMSLLK